MNSEAQKIEPRQSIKKAIRNNIRVFCFNLITASTLILSISLFSLVATSASAQYVLDKNASFVYVSGTSTSHDWTARSNEIIGSLEADIEGSYFAKIIMSKIRIPVNSLKSGKSAMDKSMYKSLKSDKHPEISFQIKSTSVSKASISVIGELSIAGVSKTVETKVTQAAVGKYIQISGEVKLKMSNYDIKPPEFLFGAFTTGDDVTITFNLSFLNNKSQ